MYLLIFWIVMLVLWIAYSCYWAKKEHPGFWVMWSFFFLGWTVAHLWNCIFEVVK